MVSKTSSIIIFVMITFKIIYKTIIKKREIVLAP